MAADVLLAFMPTHIVRVCTRQRCPISWPAIFMIDSKQQKLLTAKIAEKSRQVRKENQRTVQEVPRTQPKVFLCDLRAPFASFAVTSFVRRHLPRSPATRLFLFALCRITDRAVHISDRIIDRP
jgi:hypothetical protein